MKKHLIFAALIFTCSQWARAQAAADTLRLMKTDSLVKELPAEAPEMAPFEEYDDYDIAEAVAIESLYEEPTMPNSFRHDVRKKAVGDPEQKAYYGPGSSALLLFIAENAETPVRYGASGSVHFVVVRVLVGKDSLLYNPEIISSPGSAYSVNAQELIQKLPGTFVPARKNGKAADSYLYIPVRYDTDLKNRNNAYSNY